MRAVVQRVREASVEVAEVQISQIGRGLLILLGITHDDGEAEADWMIDKLVGLRIFSNAEGKFDASLLDVGGGMLVVSQFTLYGDTRKGRRPSFVAAAAPEHAEPLYQRVVDGISARGIPTGTGRFGADMQVHLVNDGPVTLVVDTAG
jgi:D-tyrosyl-tRNA(Tyr) deacylase